MGFVPRLSQPLRAASEQRSTAVSSLPSSKRFGRGLLSPRFVEATIAVGDVALIVGAFLLCSLIYYWLTADTLPNIGAYGGIGLIVAVNFVAMMTARQNYRVKNLMLLSRQAREITLTWLGIYGLLAIVAFTMKISSDFSRGAVLLSFAGGVATLLSWKYFVSKFLSRALTTGLFASKRVIVLSEQGEKSSSRALIELLSYGFTPIRAYEISRAEAAEPEITASLRHKLDELVQFAKSEQVQDVYLLVSWRNDRLVDGILSALCVLPISVHLLPDQYAGRFLNYPATFVGNTWTALLQRAPLAPFELATKRALDVMLATLGLFLVLPLLAIIALLIKLDSPGPVLFRQGRNGFNGKAFDIFKFRTMHVLEDGPKIRQASKDDPRVTRLGRLLRRSSIDELPQLVNVLLGDMSLVGPRPHAISHNSEYEQLIANYAFRHHVKPGVTGWAQVNGYRGETNHINQMKHRVEHDLWYINNWSIWLDAKIVFRTVLVTLRQSSNAY